MSKYYKDKNFNPQPNDWPPFRNESFTSLAIYKKHGFKELRASTKESEEMIASSENTGYSSIDENTSENINDLFDPYEGGTSYMILIKGEPGIGKTILC